MPPKTISVYTDGKDMKCKLRARLPFLEEYSYYLDDYHSNKYGMQRRERLQDKATFLNHMVISYI